VNFASIMVHVDFDELTGERIGVAAGLANRFDALLIGVAGWPLRKSEVLEDSGVAFAPSEEALQARIAEELARLGEKFRRAAGSNPRGVEWRASPHFPNEVIAAEARAADLVVIGREALPGDVYHTFDPGAVILACGRPVLVVPRGIESVQSSHVLIAWKDTREARRVVRDALPFLKAAQSVTIAVVAPQDLEEGTREQAADVVRYLEHHRIAAAPQIVTSAGEADGHALLRSAEERNADLIVAGGYGRSRLSEWIFGGVTRQLLRGSKIACLFSN
jgi:nucleotide-binding universal stress UspA family protein